MYSSTWILGYVNSSTWVEHVFYSSWFTSKQYQLTTPLNKPETYWFLVSCHAYLTSTLACWCLLRKIKCSCLLINVVVLMVELHKPENWLLNFHRHNIVATIAHFYYTCLCTVLLIIISNSCSMGTRDLPDIYALALGPNGPRARAYISGKSLLPMLQLIYSTWVTHLQV